MNPQVLALIGGGLIALVLAWPRKARAAIMPPLPDSSRFRRPDLIPVAREAAQRHGVPEDGFVKQIWIESRFDPTASSPVGASGIAQFMPGTASDYGIDPQDPRASLNAAALYMRRLHDRYADQESPWSLAAAAYNWGLGNVDKFLKGTRNPPTETRDYVVQLHAFYGEENPL